jgi:hypothetical protein
MSNSFPEEIEYNMDPAETGRSGCLLPNIDDDSSGDPDYDEATD